MSAGFSVLTRNAELNGLVSYWGAGVTAKLYNGAKPAALGVPAGAVLATLTFGSDILAANGGSAGSVAGGTLTFGGYTQNAASNVSGTPTFVRFTKADATVVADIDIGAAPNNIPFSGTVVNGQAVTGPIVYNAGDVAV